MTGGFEDLAEVFIDLAGVCGGENEELAKQRDTSGLIDEDEASPICPIETSNSCSTDILGERRRAEGAGIEKAFAEEPPKSRAIAAPWRRQPDDAPEVAEDKTPERFQRGVERVEKL